MLSGSLDRSFAVGPRSSELDEDSNMASWKVTINGGLMRKSSINAGCLKGTSMNWLVVWNIFLFSHILGIIIPIDFHIFQRGSNHQPDEMFLVVPARNVNSTHSALHDLSFACSKRQCEAATSRILATSAFFLRCKTWCKSREISSGCPEKFFVKSSAAQGRWPRAVSFQIGLALA